MRDVEMQRRTDSIGGLVVAAVLAVLWVAGILLLCMARESVRPEGLLMVIVAAMSTALLVIRSWVFRMDRAFVHGYHAGHHDATARECYPLAEDCDVVNFAEVRARR